MSEKKEKQWCVSQFSKPEGRYGPRWQFDSRDQAITNISKKAKPYDYVADPTTRGPRA